MNLEENENKVDPGDALNLEQNIRNGKTLEMSLETQARMLKALEKDDSKVVEIGSEDMSDEELGKVLINLRGRKGDKGEKGDTGERGEKGDTGDPLTWGMLSEEQKLELKGEKGDTGERGESIIGPMGPQGMIGPQGIQGMIGPAGRDGKDGKDGRNGSPDTGNDIVAKINAQDDQIDASKIKGLFKGNQIGYLRELSDVAISNTLVSGQSLVWNGSRWANGTPSAGTVTSVNSIGPDSGGNVSLTSDDIPGGSTNLYSQWITDGTDIYYTAGDVGIGIIPTQALHLATTKKIQIDGSGRNYQIYSAELSGDHRLIFIDTGVGDQARYWFDSTGAATGFSIAEGGTERAYIGTQNTGGNAFMFETKDDYDIKFRTDGGTERMRIKRSTGLVGIGTDSPSARLHVLSTTEQFRVGYDTSNYYSATVASNGAVTFDAVGAGSAFTFSDDVSVPDEAYGIGWDSSLEVPTKNAVYDKLQLFAAGTGIDHGGLTGLGDDDHTQYALLLGRSGGQSLSGGTAANDDLTLQGTTNATRTTSYVNLQPNGGLVGIGTASPTNILSVNGDMNLVVSGGVNRMIDFGVGLGATALKLYSGGTNLDWGWGLEGGRMVFYAATGGGTNSFQWRDNGALTGGTNLMVLTTLGVLTTSGTIRGTKLGAGMVPVSFVDVLGTAANATIGTESTIRTARATTGGQTWGQAFEIKVGRWKTPSSFSPDTRVDFVLKHNSDGTLSGDTTVMTWQSNGAVGIGQTAPTALLHIKAGTATANTAPIKLTSGTKLTAAEAGVYEYDGNHLFTNATIRFPVGGTLFQYIADVSVGGAEADIFTSTLAASTLNANGDKVIAEYGVNFVTVGTEATQLKVYFAGTAIWDSTAVVPATGTTSAKVQVTIIRVSSTVVRYNVSMQDQGNIGYVTSTVGELTGLTLSNTAVLKITGTSSGTGSGAGDIVGKMGFIKFEPAA